MNVCLLFYFCSWLDAEEDDGKVERVLKLRGKNNMPILSYFLVHLWSMSV